MDVADEAEAERMFNNLQDFTDVEFFNQQAKAPQPVDNKAGLPSDNMRTEHKVKSKKQSIIKTTEQSSKTQIR